MRRAGLPAYIALLTVAALGVGATSAWAAGETTQSTLTFKPAKPKFPPKKKGDKTPPSAQVDLNWKMKISKSDGSRPANMKSWEVALPNGIVPFTTGLGVCPLATIQANNDKSCPKTSVVGKGDGHINIQPIAPDAYETTGPVYFTGNKGKSATFAIYYTVTKLPSAHNIGIVTISKAGKGYKLKYGLPKLATAPGLPDATPVDASFTFDQRGPKGKLIRTTAACKAGSLTSRVAFYDNSFTSTPASLTC
jgi:hypothetical protein